MTYGAPPSAPLNFLVFRYLAAFCVLFAHSFVISGKMPNDLLSVFPALGGIAVFGVILFFLISGYLVSQSWAQKPSWLAFIRKRFIRIVPGLAGCLIFTVLLGAALTTLPALAYWQSEELPAYLMKNLLLQNYLPLPGVFASNPVAAVVNGSLWTISVEASCYLGLMALGLLGALATPARAVSVLVLTLVGAMLWGQHVNLFRAMVVHAALPGYYAAFVCGALVFLMRTYLPRSVPITLALMLASLLLPPHPFTYVLSLLMLGVSVLNLALWAGQRWPENKDSLDLSYGLYLYAFPIQQALKQTFPQDDGWLLLLKTLPLCLVCSFLSWYCIERPAKAWRKAPSSTQPTMEMSDTLHLPLV